MGNYLEYFNKKWREEEDYGLAIFSVMVILYNSAIFFTSFTLFNYAQFLALIPIFLSFIFLNYCNKVCETTGHGKFVANLFLITITVIVNYVVTGEMDRAVGGLQRLDSFCINFDNWLWGGAVALWIEEATSILGGFQFLFYDLIMVVYFFYFIMPVLGGVLLFKTFAVEDRWKISRFFFTFLFSYMFNNTLYLLIPVTGPQYYLKEIFTTKLPLSKFGWLIHGQVVAGQKTFIDCFPSGHVWITLLVVLWLFHVRSFWRYISLIIWFLMILATLGLRYHYTLDLIVGAIFAVLVYLWSFKLFPSR